MVEFTDDPKLMVLQDVCTRWNSTFLMFERLLQLKTSLITYLSSCEIANDPAGSKQGTTWLQQLMNPATGFVMMEKLVNLLRQPFEDTKRVSSRKFLISEVGTLCK